MAKPEKEKEAQPVEIATISILYSAHTTAYTLKLQGQFGGVEIKREAKLSTADHVIRQIVADLEVLGMETELIEPPLPEPEAEVIE